MSVSDVNLNTPEEASGPVEVSDKHELVTAKSTVVEEPSAPISPPVPSPSISHHEDEVVNNGGENGSDKHELADGEEPVSKRMKLEPSSEEADVNVDASVNTVVDSNAMDTIETPSEALPEPHEEVNGEIQPVKEESSLKSEESSTTSSVDQKPANGADNTVPTSGTSAPASEEERDYSELDAPEASEDGMPKHQQKFALSVLKSVKRLKDAGPFVQPVDPIKLNIPTYNDIVKQPMDLGTLEKKLTANEYPTVVSFVNDFNLIVSNCILFNGKESFISNMARGLKASFAKHMTNMPKYDATTQAPAKPKSKPAPPTPRGTPKTPRAAAQVANAAVTSSGTPESTKPFALNPSGVPTIRRDSAVDGRPKREIHPPRSRDLPYGDIKPRKKKFAAELRFCGQVLKDIMSKKHEDISFPFLAPVDPVALDCPTYFKIIKEPMDLSTVQDKYNKNQYETAEEFEADVRLMFRNCYKFNPDGSPVNVLGHKLEALFDKKWEEKPIPAPTPPPDSSEDEFSDEDDYDINELTVTNPAISFLEEQLETIKSQLATLRKQAVKAAREEAKRASGGVASKKRRKSAKGPVGAGAESRRKSSTGGARRASISGLNAPAHVTYAMKKELSDKIQTISEKKLRHVVSIIQESMPNLKDAAEDEIELDMDQLDPNTLMRLYNFVVKKDEAPKPKAPKVTPPLGGRKKKSKPLTEAEQSRQIEELQKKMQMFDKAKEGGTAVEDAQSSEEESSDDDDGAANGSSDDSSSEEE